MGEPSINTPPSEKLPEVRLDSWKEIAAYLKRDVTTVQRWEKREGMPIHRHVHERRGSVYALPEELDEWIRSRRPTVEEPEAPEVEILQPAPSSPDTQTPSSLSRQPGAYPSWRSHSCSRTGPSKINHANYLRPSQRPLRLRLGRHTLSSFLRRHARL